MLIGTSCCQKIELEAEALNSGYRDVYVFRNIQALFGRVVNSIQDAAQSGEICNVELELKLSEDNILSLDTKFIAPIILED